MSIRPLYILILLIVATSARAQHAATPGDTVLKGTTIEVIQSYKPQVKQVPKPEWVPQIPPADTSHPKFKYDVPLQTLYYTYSSQPLRPLALGIDSGKLPFPNYVKVGAGNLSTLFLDAGIGGITGRNYETAIHLHHISQQGDLKYQQTALSGIEAEGLLHKANNDWHAAIIGERNQYYYYGFPDNESKDSLKQVYTTIRAVVDMANRDSGDSKLSYHPSVSASVYDAKFNASETNIGFNAPFLYKMDSALQFQVALTGALTHFSTNLENTNNNYIELLPGIQFNKPNISGHALLGLAEGKNSNGYILPDVVANVPIASTGLMASAGWQASLRQNTYEQLTTENPYLYTNYNVTQTRRDEVFLNLAGSTGQHLTWSGRLSWRAYNDLPTYLNNIGNEKQFFVDYQQVRAVSLQLAARYQVANTWSAGISGDFYDFYQSTDKHVWQQPDTKIKGDFTILPLPKLTITAYLAVLGGIYAESTSLQAIKLKTITDLGGNAEYQFIPRLSAFVQVSNLLNDKYQRWMGYQAYGLNLYGGLRLKF